MNARQSSRAQVPAEPEVIAEVPVVEPADVIEPDVVARAQDPTQTPTVEIDGKLVNPAVPDPRGEDEVPPFISEGTARDIEMHGFAIDPISGKRLTADDLPKGRPAVKQLKPVATK